MPDGKQLLKTSSLVAFNWHVSHGDTWVFVDGDPPTWRRLALSGPTPRRGHTMVWDISENVLVLFGGETPGGLSPETWEFDLDED